MYLDLMGLLVSNYKLIFEEDDHDAVYRTAESDFDTGTLEVVSGIGNTSGYT